MSIYDEEPKIQVKIVTAKESIKDSVMNLMTEIQKQFKAKDYPQMAGANLTLLKEPYFFISGKKVSIRDVENHGIGTAVFKVGTKDFKVVFNIESNFHLTNRGIWNMTSLVEANFKPEFSWGR